LLFTPAVNLLKQEIWCSYGTHFVPSGSAARLPFGVSIPVRSSLGIPPALHHHRACTPSFLSSASPTLPFSTRSVPFHWQLSVFVAACFVPHTLPRLHAAECLGSPAVSRPTPSRSPPGLLLLGGYVFHSQDGSRRASLISCFNKSPPTRPLFRTPQE